MARLLAFDIEFDFARGGTVGPQERLEGQEGRLLQATLESCVRYAVGETFYLHDSASLATLHSSLMQRQAGLRFRFAHFLTE